MTRASKARLEAGMTPLEFINKYVNLIDKPSLAILPDDLDVVEAFCLGTPTEDVDVR
jgi:hypothetical protein